MKEIGFLKKLIVVGDRVLLEALNDKQRSSGGLYLPPNVTAKDEVQTGKVIRVGPGYPVPNTSDFDEFLKDGKEPVQYVPLQVKEGDLAIFLRKQAIEIEYDDNKYLLVNQSAILLLEREELSGLEHI